MAEDDIVLPRWLDAPDEMIHAGLERAGLSYRQSMQMGNLPPIPADGYRSGTLSNKANYKIDGDNKGMDLTSTYYAKFAINGTGMFGPYKFPIVPVNAFQLSWLPHGSSEWAHAKYTQGYIWHGFRDQLVGKIVDGFIQGMKEFRGDE
jgi:hypothetical protein